ncbi:MAG TPA: hypothetical protein VG206_18775 [Terriglobia bacterium]|nr:hypothetical protein [Terriglobia bacterium]
MTPEDIAQRLEKLERDNRRLKGFAVGVLVLATALSAIDATQPIPDVIKTHKLVVVDARGEPRAFLSGTEDPVSYKEENYQIGPDLELLDPKGNPGISLGYVVQKKVSIPGLMLNDPTKARITILAQPSGYPQIELSDAQGQSTDLTSTSVAFKDAKGNARAIVGAEADIGANIELRDAAGETRARMLVNPSGVPTIKLDNAEGYSLALGILGNAVAPYPPVAISIYGSDKKHSVIWQAPPNR